MKVLGLMGSPRRGGNSDLLLDRALAGAQDAGAEVEKIILNTLKIRPCQHCDGCVETGICVVKDEEQEIHVKLREADVVILSSPIFFMSISAQTKAMIDRCQALWVEKYVLRRPKSKPKSQRRGLFISVAGLKRDDVFVGAMPVVRAFFATVDVTFADSLLYSNVDKKGEIIQRPEALQEAYDAGRRMVEEAAAAQKAST